MLQYTKYFLLYFFAFLIISCESNQTVETENSTANKDSIQNQPEEIIYKGQIQSAGLSAEEMKNIGEGNIAFQLIGEQNYFLIGDSSIKNHWGSCVEITGGLLMYIPNENVNLYDRNLLQVNTIKAFSGPCIYADFNTEIPKDKTETLTGKVKRIKRPAPDIAYDYELVLDKPYIEKNSQYEENLQVKSIVLTGDKNTIANLEKAIDLNQSVQIEGAKTHGYAESIVFAVNGVNLAISNE